MALINGLHHAKILCTKKEYDEEIKFFTEGLKLRLVSKSDECAIIDTGNGLIEIFCDADSLPEMGIVRHFAFDVDDVAACIDKVEKAGYRIKEYPIDVMFNMEEPRPATIGFCYDPCGQEIEFFHWR